MNPAMIVCYFVYLIPAIAFFMRILFEIFLIVEFVTIRVAYIMQNCHNLIHICIYMKSSTVFFMFELKNCMEHVYFELCQYVNGMSEEIK